MEIAVLTAAEHQNVNIPDQERVGVRCQEPFMLKMKRVCIVAWHNPDQTKNANRITAHRRQVEYLLKAAPEDADIRILTCNWESSVWRSDDQRVTYIDSPAQFCAGEGRNILLREFYASEDDWAMFLDDDCIPCRNDKCDGSAINLWEFLDKYPQVLEVADSFTVGFGRWIKDLGKWDSTLVPKPEFIGGCFAMCNFKKRYGEELYFTPNQIMEDYEMWLKVLDKGHRHYSLSNPYFCEFSQASSQFADKNDRRKKNSAAKFVMFNRWKARFPLLKLGGDENRRMILGAKETVAANFVGPELYFKAGNVKTVDLVPTDNRNSFSDLLQAFEEG